MIDVEAKYDHSKTDTSKFDRRFAVSPLEAGAEVAVRQLADHSLSDDAPKPAPHNTAWEGAAVSPDVGVPVVDGGPERAGGNFPGEKSALSA